MKTNQWRVYVHGQFFGTFLLPAHWTAIQVRRHLIDVKQYPESVVVKLDLVDFCPV